MNKLDLIINALEYAADKIYCENNDDIIAQALTTARELRALEPVAWADWSMDGVQYSDIETTYGEPLFALGKSND